MAPFISMEAWRVSLDILDLVAARRVVVAVVAGAGLTGLILGSYWVTARFYLGGGLLLSGLLLTGVAVGQVAQGLYRAE